MRGKEKRKSKREWIEKILKRPFFNFQLKAIKIEIVRNCLFFTILGSGKDKKIEKRRERGKGEYRKETDVKKTIRNDR